MSKTKFISCTGVNAQGDLRKLSLDILPDKCSFSQQPNETSETKSKLAVELTGRGIHLAVTRKFPYHTSLVVDQCY